MIPAVRRVTELTSVGGFAFVLLNWNAEHTSKWMARRREKWKRRMGEGVGRG